MLYLTKQSNFTLFKNHFWYFNFRLLFAKQNWKQLHFLAAIRIILLTKKLKADKIFVQRGIWFFTLWKSGHRILITEALSWAMWGFSWVPPFYVSWCLLWLNAKSEPFKRVRVGVHREWRAALIVPKNFWHDRMKTVIVVFQIQQSFWNRTRYPAKNLQCRQKFFKVALFKKLERFKTSK